MALPAPPAQQLRADDSPHLLDLPPEMLIYILSAALARTAARAATTCRSLRTAALATVTTLRVPAPRSPGNLWSATQAPATSPTTHAQALSFACTLPALRSLCFGTPLPRFDAAHASGIAALTALTHLKVQATCRVARLARTPCWKPLSALVCLRHLALRDLKLNHDSLDALSAVSALRRLAVRSCGLLDTHFAALAKLTALEWLDISGNVINDSSLRALASGTPPMAALSHLDLSDNVPSDNLFSSKTASLRLLATLPALRTLTLDALWNVAAAAVALSAVTQLQHVEARLGTIPHVSDDYLRGLGMTLHHPRDLAADAQQDYPGMLGLGEMLFQSMEHAAPAPQTPAPLHSLEVSNGPLHFGGGLPTLVQLPTLTRLVLHDPEKLDGLSSLTQLRELHLLGYSTCGRSAGAVLGAIACLTLLETLNLSHCSLAFGRPARAPELTRLSALTRLQHLQLEHSHLAWDCAHALVDLTALKSLRLAGNMLGNRGALALAALTGLLCLNLNGNELSGIADVPLWRLSNLRQLDLGGNRIGMDGVRALTCLSKLEALGIAGCGVALGRALPVLSSLPRLQRLVCQGGHSVCGSLNPPHAWA